jgi:hypothetical protein
MQEPEPSNRPLEPSGERIDPMQPKPAITITIQSWATPVVAIIMLAAGLLFGYFGRPLIAERLSRSDQPDTAQEAPSGSGQNTAVPDAQTNASLDERRQELMAFVIENTRHFKGDPNAPVTLIEFGDFQ